MTDQYIPFSPAHFNRCNNVLTEQIKSVDFFDENHGNIRILSETFVIVFLL